MKRKRTYTIALRDTSRLENIATVELKKWKIAAVALFFVVFSTLLGGFIIWVTPLHEFLPGYMHQDARTATEEAVLRLDSLQTVVARNQAFMTNLLDVLGNAELSDSAKIESRVNTFNDESQLEASRSERDFIKKMQQNEKHNISILAPLAAEGLLFYPVNEESIISEGSRNQRVANVIIPVGSPVCSIADGSVIAVNRNGAINNYSIVIQHPHGFVSRYSQVGNPFVDQGEKVLGGQTLAISAAPNSDGILLEMWHNGSPLIPYSYIGHLADENHLRTWNQVNRRGNF